MRPSFPEGDSDPRFVTIDLNATGTTTLYSPGADKQGTVVYVRIPNPGANAKFRVEVQDGTDTVGLYTPAAGNTVDERGMRIPLGSGETLQVNVTTAEGSALTTTAFIGVYEEA